ncbi:hypothetical protein OnM2_078028 [Erysiphe neolycopersici]|uniref:Uncharacterized protein n=1 Tax=Erysiphe neolycopersici TaxID=212602 RepID=A0A420HH47_9PEZI|nr:hypothetical protein OnM2_078028 [Erysiphe neolycopersici]
MFWIQLLVMLLCLDRQLVCTSVPHRHYHHNLNVHPSHSSSPADHRRNKKLLVACSFIVVTIIIASFACILAFHRYDRKKIQKELQRRVPENRNPSNSVEFQMDERLDEQREIAPPYSSSSKPPSYREVQL